MLTAFWGDTRRAQHAEIYQIQETLSMTFFDALSFLCLAVRSVYNCARAANLDGDILRAVSYQYDESS